MKHILRNDFLQVTIDDIGAELISVVGKDGFEYIWDANPEYWGDHSPVLFPACGRLLNSKYTYDGKEYDMKGHGFARRKIFSVVKSTETELELLLKNDEETLEIYPFNFELLASFELSGNQLKANFTVKNTDSKTLPYMFGWHPGFTLDGDSDIGSFGLKFEGIDSLTWYPLQHTCFVRPYGEEYPIKDSTYLLNEEEIYANDTMIFVGTGDKTVMSSPTEKHGVDFAWSKNLPYFCIWKETTPKARFICLEPWSDVPSDGETAENFNTRKMSRLESGQSERYSYEIKFN